MAPRACIMGIDPGKTGAVAFYFPEHDAVSARDMPVVGKDVDGASLTAMLEQIRPDLAIVERVASRPGQGIASAFNFGKGFGLVLGVIVAREIPLHLVTPNAWKKSMKLDADKERSRAMALRLWPSRADLFGRKMDHGRAEAALLALYAHKLDL